jgi:hypothetical protein
MPANKKETRKHDHPQYKRWMSMNQRCYCPTVRGCNERRALGVKVDPVWSQENPEGLNNFAAWVEEKLKEKPELRDIEFRIIRSDLTKDYGPNNCILGTPQAATQHRVTSVLNEDLVITMRRHKRANKDASLAEMEKLFGQSQVNISRALRGITWSSVDHIEPPIPKFGSLKQEPTDE